MTTPQRARTATVCSVRVATLAAAAALADMIREHLTVHPGEHLTVRASGSTVVVAYATHAEVVDVADRLRSVFKGDDVADLLGDGLSDRYWVDSTGALARILGDNQDAWDAFAALLPGATDTLTNLASVADRISTPGRPVTVTPTGTSAEPITRQ